MTRLRLAVRFFLSAALILGGAFDLVAPVAAAAAGSPSLRVSAEGILESPASLLERMSPAGAWRMRIDPVQVGFDQMRADLEVASAAGTTRIPAVQGNGFFISDLGRVIVLETAESNAFPSTIRIYEPTGAMIWTGTLFAPRNPALSCDGRNFVCGDRDGTFVLDLENLSTRRAPKSDLWAAGPDGMIAGISYGDETGIGGGLTLEPSNRAVRRFGEEIRAALSQAPGNPFLRIRGLAFAGGALFLATPERLLRLPLDPGGEGAIRSVLELPAGEIRDLRTAGDAVTIGVRRVEGDLHRGEMITVGTDGTVRSREAGPSAALSRAEGVPVTSEGIPWPIAPNSQHPVGNTYGEYQNYGGAPYPHPGFDVMGSPNQPVFAVRSGVVKAILTTSGEWHWRVAIGDSVMAGTERGYLYAHLNQSSITVHVGDLVTVGQQIGTLVEWPGWNFTHCHFTRIEDSGTTWDGTWLSVHNPHLDVNHTETAAPVFQPARGTDLLAFCNNNSSTYQSPTSLHGAVDIIAHVSDQIATTWKCTVQELRYTIYPVGNPGAPVVNNKLAVFYDFVCDTYGAGSIDAFMISLLYKQDSTCQTRGDYDYREFYQIISNSDGDQLYGPEDVAEAWNTAAVPDGPYVIRVTAIDAAGNAKSDSMTVTTYNPASEAAGAPRPGEITVDLSPSPMRGVGSFRFSLPTAAAHVSLGIYGTDGRLLRTLVQGGLPAGEPSVLWDGRDESGRKLPGGVYLYRLRGDVKADGRIVMVK